MSGALSHRQIEIAGLVKQGLRNKQIAEKVLLTERGVKWHMAEIFRKLKLANRTQLLIFMLKGETK
jgi:two-component system nitrate/nitrite response regulator NarP